MTVRVWNREKRAIFSSDGRIEADAEADVSEEDALLLMERFWVVEVAEDEDESVQEEGPEQTPKPAPKKVAAKPRRRKVSKASAKKATGNSRQAQRLAGSEPAVTTRANVRRTGDPGPADLPDYPG